VSRQAGLRKGCPGVRTPAVDEPLNRTGARLHHPLILSRLPNIEQAFRHRREIWIEFIRCRVFQDTGRSLGRSLEPRRRCSASRACFGLVVDAHRGDAGTDAFTHHAPDRHDSAMTGAAVDDHRETLSAIHPAIVTHSVIIAAPTSDRPVWAPLRRYKRTTPRYFIHDPRMRRGRQRHHARRVDKRRGMPYRPYRWSKIDTSASPLTFWARRGRGGPNEDARYPGWPSAPKPNKPVLHSTRQSVYLALRSRANRL
jgi:hypothetical protein